MSHTARINTKLKTINLESFKRALRNLGWIIRENTTARTYHSDPARHTVYPMVAVNPMDNGFDVGITFNEETKEIEVNYDPFGGSVYRSLGQDLANLKKEYNCCVIEDVMAFQGYSTTRQLLENGTILVQSTG